MLEQNSLLFMMQLNPMRYIKHRAGLKSPTTVAAVEILQPRINVGKLRGEIDAGRLVGTGTKRWVHSRKAPSKYGRVEVNRLAESIWNTEAGTRARERRAKLLRYSHRGGSLLFAGQVPCVDEKLCLSPGSEDIILSAAQTEALFVGETMLAVASGDRIKPDIGRQTRSLASLMCLPRLSFLGRRPTETDGRLKPPPRSDGAYLSFPCSGWDAKRVCQGRRRARPVALRVDRGAKLSTFLDWRWKVQCGVGEVIKVGRRCSDG